MDCLGFVAYIALFLLTTLWTQKCKNPRAVFLNIFGVKEPQIDTQQAADPYLIKCRLKSPHLMTSSYSITVYTLDWQISSEECETYEPHSYTFPH